MPRKITNNHNLPEAIFRAVQIDNHRTMGDISVTQLIDSPQIIRLKKENDYEEDAMDMIWALTGTATHHILEQSEIRSVEARTLKAAQSILRDKKQDKVADWVNEFITKEFPNDINNDIMLEKTLSIEVDGMVISGTLDKFDKISGVLEDYKTCSSFMWTMKEAQKKWYAQQNIYAYMLREHGYEVKESMIRAIFRDFSYAKAKSKRNYPQLPVMSIDVPLYKHEQIKEYLKVRVELHRRSRQGEIMECDGKERWANADSWAVKVPGRKNAVKVADSVESAQAWLDQNGFKYEKPEIEFRPGEDRRCTMFCPVKQFCAQYGRRAEIRNELLKAKQID